MRNNQCFDAPMIYCLKIIDTENLTIHAVYFVIFLLLIFKIVTKDYSLISSKKMNQEK